MATKLYYSVGTCSPAVHIALCEVDAQFGLIAVDLAKHLTTDDTDFYIISPRDYMPLLKLVDSSRHTEGAALLQYIADLDPTQMLIGKPGSAHRLTMIKRPAFTSIELHKGFGPFWYKDTPKAMRQSVKDRLTRYFAELDTCFAEQPCLANTYNVADACALAALNWTNILAPPMGAYPNAQAYMIRTATRSYMVEALTAESLVRAGETDKVSAIA